MRAFWIALGFAVATVVSLAGLRGRIFADPPIEFFPDMRTQPKILPQARSGFFADGQASRPPVAGTVPMGWNSNGPSAESRWNPDFSGAPNYRNSGKIGANWGTGIPFPVTSDVLNRGKERFTIFCAACHGGTGDGNSVMRELGMVTVANLLDPRIRTMSEGEIFSTITQGKNTMRALGDKLPIADRWAVIAYLRALQLSQGGATLEDVPADMRPFLESRP